MQNKTNKPIHEVRLGCIKAAVWKNNTEKGARFNITSCRLYKNDDPWASSDSFGRDDLLLLGKGPTKPTAGSAPPKVKTTRPIRLDENQRKRLQADSPCICHVALTQPGKPFQAPSSTALRRRDMLQRRTSVPINLWQPKAFEP